MEVQEETKQLLGKLRSLNGEVKKLKGERDQATKKVKELKTVRNTNQQKATKVYELLKRAGKNIDPSLERIVEKMEFEYQTKPMPFDKEKEFIKKLDALKAELNESKIIRKLQKDFDNFRSAANRAHTELLRAADLSEGKHRQMMQMFDEKESLEKKLDEAFNRLHVQMKDERKQTDVRIKSAMEFSKRQTRETERHLKEKSEEVVEKLKGKKKFDLRDLQILDKSGKPLNLFKDERKQNL